MDLFFDGEQFLFRDTFFIFVGLFVYSIIEAAGLGVAKKCQFA